MANKETQEQEQKKKDEIIQDFATGVFNGLKIGKSSFDALVDLGKEIERKGDKGLAFNMLLSVSSAQHEVER